MLQESCVQSEVTILHLGGGSSSVEELKDNVMHISLSRNQDCLEAVPTFDCFSCFCIPSLP